MCENANHLICESELTSLIVCIFYEHVYCFISALTLAQFVTTDTWCDVDTLAIYGPKYFDLEHCSCKQPVCRGDKQIALVKQIKHWQNGSPRHLTLCLPTAL